MGKVGAEARARVAAETDLIRRRKAEFERLLKTRERVQAVCALVDKHKIEYSKLVAEYRVHFERSSAA